MRNKYFYPIFKLKAKSWIRYWLLKKTEFKGKLSEILTGFSFNLQNTLRQKFVKFEKQGHSEQETTEGYNQYNYNDFVDATQTGITFNKQEDGGIKVNGTSTAMILKKLSNNSFQFIQGKTYYISGGINNNVSLSLRNESGNETYLTNNNGVASYTPQNDISAYFFVRISNRTTTNTTIYPMISEVNKPFEKYTNGASPNPSYEQPIKSAGENVQLLDKSYYEQGSIDGTTGQDISNEQNGRGSNYIPVLPNTKYTLSCNTILAQLRLSEYGNNKSHIQRDIVTNSKTLTITTTANTYYLRWSLNYDGSTTVTKDLIDSLNLKLEPGSTATPWSPYGMGSITEKIVNRNFANCDNMVTSSSNGIDYTIKKEKGLLKSINVNGTVVNYASILAGGTFILKAGTYKLYGNGISDDIVMQLLSPSLSELLYFVGKNDKEIIVTEDKKVLIRYRINVGASFNNIKLYPKIYLSTVTDDTYTPHEEQTKTYYTQQPFRSIGDVRDVFVKENGVWYERHLPYIASYNGEELPQDVYTESGGIKYCNDKSMSTTGQFSTGASVQYIDESNWTYIPCTQSQIDILENLPITYEGQTNVYSTDKVEPYLKIQYWESDTKNG